MIKFIEESWKRQRLLDEQKTKTVTRNNQVVIPPDDYIAINLGERIMESFPSLNDSEWYSLAQNGGTLKISIAFEHAEEET